MPQENQGCLGFLYSLIGRTPEPNPEALPYRTRDHFLSRAELSFYGVLRLVVAERMVICPKVSLGDIFFVATKEGTQAYRNKIDRKHVDFLLCDPQTLSPIMGIELDDASHQREARQERDAFVEAVFEAAGLPIIRMPAQSSYTKEEVSSLLGDALSLSPGRQVSVRRTIAPALQQPSAPAGPPLCPKCGIPMVPRKARKDGTRFYGCSNYPKCMETAPMK